MFHNLIKILKYIEPSNNVCRSLSLNANQFVRNGKIPIDMSYTLCKQLTSNSTEGPPLIIMHGLFGSKENWHGLCEPLVKNLENRDVFLVDARNHGDSPHTREHRYEDMAEDVVEFMSRRKFKKISVLGHSMGGRCMMYLALKYPDLIEKAVIVDISPLSQSDIFVHMASVCFILERVHVSQELTMHDALANADDQLQQFNLSPPVRNFLLTNLVRNRDGKYRWQFNLDALSKSFAGHILLFPADAIKMKYYGPILFIGGVDTDSISEDQLPTIKRKYFPNAEIIMLQNCGHMVHVDQPQKLVNLVSRFLR